MEKRSKARFHARNRHQGHYDFQQLIKSCPELGPFVSMNPYGNLSINFADPAAVKLLNRALLQNFYGVLNWDIPPNYLCPPIPGRSEYLHYAADLLASCNDEVVPRGASVRGLDIGVGANCIYPIVGHCEYGWRWVGTDIDAAALAAAGRIVQANQKWGNAIEFRLQKAPSKIFDGVLEADDRFDLVVCNPPFHSSLEEASEGSRRKWSNLGRKSRQAPVLNFGGHGRELWCPGGEAVFVRQMAEESAHVSKNVFWFSVLLSKESTLAGLYWVLNKVKAEDIRTIPMEQGQKKSRLVAWTFLSPAQQREWRKQRWSQEISKK